VAATAAFGQRGPAKFEYALVLEDSPVARKVESRAALQSAAAREHFARIGRAQAAVITGLKQRKMAVTGATQTLVNAVFVSATPEAAAGLRDIPGVAYVVRAP